MSLNRLSAVLNEVDVTTEKVVYGKKKDVSNILIEICQSNSLSNLVDDEQELSEKEKIRKLIDEVRVKSLVSSQQLMLRDLVKVIQYPDELVADEVVKMRDNLFGVCGELMLSTNERLKIEV